MLWIRHNSDRIESEVRGPDSRGVERRDRDFLQHELDELVLERERTVVPTLEANRVGCRG